MEVIKLDYPHQIEEHQSIVLALGYFDGIHKGHQEVIQTAKNIAIEKNCLSAVMTFDPHPSVVLGKFNGPAQNITPLHQKIKWIESLGIDRMYVVHFTSTFAKLSPQEFVDQFIIGLHAVHVVAGFDYTYGHLGKGTTEDLSHYSRGEFSVTVIDKVAKNSEKISSTFIRKCILEGNVAILPEYLGRYYEIIGSVVNGEKRGRKIGFPTANIEVSSEYILPPTGVYAVRMKVKEHWYEGVCNIGYKPTFHDPGDIQKSIEVHLLNFNEMIYGENISLEFHSRIRDEQKFPSIDKLIEQIEKDKRKAESYFHSLKHC